MAQRVKNCLQCRRHRRHTFDPWVRKIPWRRAWQPTLVFLPRESRGQRGLVGCGLWGGKESKTTEVTEHAHTGTVKHTLLPTGIFSEEKQLMIMKKWTMTTTAGWGEWAMIHHWLTGDSQLPYYQMCCEQEPGNLQEAWNLRHQRMGIW